MPPRPAALWSCPQCVIYPPPSYLPIRTLTLSSSRRATTSTNTTSQRSAIPMSPSLMNAPAATSGSQSFAPTAESDSRKPIPPTSPRFISIPQSLQPDALLYRRKKGFLPVARDIFKPRPGRLGQLTTSQTTSLTKTTRERRRGPAPAAHANRNAYLTRLAAIRRENLQSGIKLLIKRRERQQARLSARSERNAAERTALMSAPMPEDEQLTRTSVTDIITAPLRGRRGNVPDPDRAQRLAEKRTRVSTIESRKAERTQLALHELFVQARSFIVNEEQLDREIESEFGTQKIPRTWKNGEVSVWGEGPPPTLQNLIEQAGRASGPAAKTLKDEDVDARERLMRHRLGKIAEELTGGKMG